MSFRFRSMLSVGLLASAVFACGHDDADDTAQTPIDTDTRTMALDDETTSSPTQTDAFGEPAAAAACAVTVAPAKELMITDLRIVEDPTRTTWAGATAGADGAWTFGRLMTAMAGPNDPQAFVRKWLASWETARTVNGFTVPARTQIQSQVIAPWPKDAAGKLDLTKAPMRLLAIVNRLDLRDLSKGNAGEGRFVFGVTNGGSALSFTVILEYTLPAKDATEAKAWASLWHELGALSLGSSAYKAKLQQITDKFAGRDADPTRPNGSAISQVRTNEIALAGPWELREFHVNATSKQLTQSTVAKTPDSSLLRSPRTGDFVNQHEAQILAENFGVPAQFEGAPFRGGDSLNNIDFWAPPNVTNNQARHLFSVNTCNGCHGAETQTGFLHVNPRAAGQPATLSAFLTGETVSDPVSGQSRTFADLTRRKKDMQNFLCATAAQVAAAPVNTRVH